MRRSRRRRGKPNRHVSLSATDAEWAVVSGNAERRGLSKARYLMGLVERDISGEDSAPPMVLAPDEQRALLASVRAIHALLTDPRGREAPMEDAAFPVDRADPPPLAEIPTSPPPTDAPPPPAESARPDTADPSGPRPRQGRLL